MRRLLRDRSPEVDTMPLTLMRVNHGDAVYCPSRWSRAVPLAHALSFYIARGAGRLFRITETRSEEEFHVLDCAEERLACLLVNSERLKDERGDWVSDPVVAVVCIHSRNSRW